MTVSNEDSVVASTQERRPQTEAGVGVTPYGYDIDRLMDDMQVLYGMRSGHVVGQDDLDALNRLDKHWRDDGERVADAYHRGFTDGLHKFGGGGLVQANERANAAWVEASTDRMMRRLADQRTATLKEALADAYRFISQPMRMEAPRGGPKTATYRIEGYNALTSKIRAALGWEDGSQSASEPRGDAQRRATPVLTTGEGL